MVDIDAAVQAMTKLIDNACEPDMMSKADALQFNEEIEEHCRSAAEALRDEMDEDD